MKKIYTLEKKRKSSVEEKRVEHFNLKQKIVVLLIVALFLVSLALYFPILNNDFHTWDDDVYVRQNEKVQQGVTFENVLWAFSTNYFGFYYPMTWISHMIDCQIYGLNAKGHYLTNILLHSFNVILLFVFLILATGNRMRSFVVAVLFALHPMNVESVAWIAERKNLLSTFFLLLALIFYVLKFKEEKNERQRGVFTFGCYLSFILGLMSKSSIVMFPVLLIILDYWPLRRAVFDFKNISEQVKIIFKFVKEKIPLFILSIASSIITIISQKEITALEPVSEVTFLDRVGEALLGYGFYLEKLFLPFNLCVLYPHHKGNYPLYLPVFIFGLLTILTMLFVFMAKRKPILIAGWLFFLISLLPVIGLLQVGLQGYADRYVYFPYWGLFIIIVFGLDFKEWFSQKPFFKYASIVFGLIVAVFLFFISREQMKTWNNDEALFQNVMKVSPNAFIAPFQLGFVQKSKGNFEKAKPYYQKALEIAEEDIRLKPKSGRAYHNKGNALLMLEKYDEAIECFVKAKEYGFDAKDINEKIEIAKKFILKQIVSEGKKLGEENRWNEAEMKFREAVKIDPNSAELWSYLGYILDQKNDLDEAQKAFEKALEINPLYDTAIYNLSIVELKKNKLDKIDQRLSLLEKLHSPYAQQLKSLLSE